MAHTLIVHPTDLGPVSEAAFRHALKIAVAERARLRIIHLREPQAPAAPLSAFPAVRQTLVRWGALNAGADEDALAGALGLSVSKAEALADDPEAALEHMLAGETPQLVVMGTAAREGLDQLLIGSFAERLARHVAAPALIVPAGADGFVDAATGALKLRNILIPVAEDPSAAHAVDLARRLAVALGAAAHTHFLHVGPAGSMPNRPVDPAHPHSTLERQGPLVETIVAAAADVAADLIVMATAGHTGPLDALRGSTTEQVLRHAHRPLLAVPAR